MAIKRHIILALAVIASAAISVSAYTLHKVQKGETLWGIANKYNVTIEQLLELNPNLNNGLKADTKIKIPENSTTTKNPVKEGQTAQSQTDKPSDKTATPKQNESLPKVIEPQDDATKPGTKAPTQSAYNSRNSVTGTPQNSKDNTESSASNSSVASTEKSNYYTTRYGDSFKSISKNTGTPIDTLRRYNPFVDESTILEGSVLRLNGQPVIFTEPRPLTLIDSIEYKIMPQKSNSTIDQTSRQTIVLILPFGNLKDNAEALSRQNHLATEFYKGFLLASNKQQSNDVLPDIRIVAIDSQNKPDQITAQLDGLGLGKNTIIIPSDEETVLTAVAKYAEDNGIMVLNTLSIKDTNYTTNPNVIQCNINQALMYERAISYITNEFADYIPVILKLKDGAKEKTSFIDALKKNLEANAVEPIEITYNHKLTDKDLAKLKKKNKYLFIPISGSAEVFASFAEPLSKYFSENNEDSRLRLFGYPDWVILTGNNLNALHDMNGIIYSRFFVDNDDIFTKEIQEDFTKWYGEEMMSAFPVQAILGYDTANLIFRMLRKKWIDSEIDKFAEASFTGEQSSFHFVKDNDSQGYINDALYIVEYLPGENYYVKVIDK